MCIRDRCSAVVNFILNDIATGEVMREATMETVMVASLRGIPTAMMATAITAMVRLVGHSITFGFWSRNRLPELTEVLLGRCPDELIAQHLKEHGHEDEAMKRLKDSMPDGTLWPFCWNLRWIELLLDPEKEAKFVAGMEGWEDLISDDSVDLSTMLELLENGFNYPPTTKDMVKVLKLRKTKGWLAVMTINCPATRAALVQEVGDLKIELERNGVDVPLMSRAKVEGTPPEPYKGTSKTGIRPAPATPTKATESPTVDRSKNCLLYTSPSPRD